MILNFDKPGKPVAAVGIYDFSATAKDDISKQGKEMLTVTVWIKDAAGQSYEIKDYWGNWNTDRIKEFCVATNRLSILETGELRASMINGAQGRCVVAIKPADGQYKDSNIVKSYLPFAASLTPKKIMTPDDIRAALG